jgi:predicted TIM-barrel fold metal-dependent hydrolase
MTRYPIISADDHIDLQFLPADIFTARVPPDIRDRVPRVIQTDSGGRWMYEGRDIGPHGTQTGSNNQTSGFKNALERSGTLRTGELRPTTPKLRLQDMARDGVAAQVLYGPVSGMVALMSMETDILLACFRAYNEWLAEFCAAAPTQFLGAGLIPFHDPRAAAEEIYHLAELKLPQAMFMAASATPGVYEPAWEPLWTAAEETGVIIGFHISVGTLRSVRPEHHAQNLAATGTNMALLQLQLDEPVAEVILAGVLERHPRLKIVVAEAGIGWIPFVLQRLEHALDRLLGNREYWEARGGFNLTLRPTEYFRRQMWATFQEDAIGIRLLDAIGADRVMWASDYPHPDGTFPYSQKAIEEQLGHLDEATRQLITSENARRLYNLPAIIG